MIEVVINGERKLVDETRSLAAVLEESGFICTRIAVAVNSEFIARSSYENHFLAANDRLDVVAPVAGG